MHATLPCAALAALLTGLAAETADARQPDQSFVVSLPLVVDDTRYPAILVETTTRELHRVSPAGLAYALAGLVNEDTLTALTAMGPDLVEIARIQQLGLELSLNPRSLTLDLEIALDRRATQTNSLARDWVIWGDEVIEPDKFAFGVTGAAHLRDSVTDARGMAADLSLNGFVNLGGSRGVSIDWGGRYTVSPGGTRTLQRDRVTAFIDRPESARRLMAGDLAPQLARNQGILNLLGISHETNYRALQPTRNIRPTGDRSLLLERPSTVEIYVNGALVDRFEAEPGPIDLRDIPLASTSNSVTILVEDDLGRREIDRFSLSANIALLAPGLDETVWAIGFARDETADGFSYDLDRPVLGGLWTRGVNNALTVMGSGALTPDLRSISGGAAWPWLGGVAQGEVTLSDADQAGRGHAVALAFTGGPYWPETRYTTLNLRLDYEDNRFADLSDPSSRSDTRWSLGGDARISLTDQLSMSAGAQYQDRHSESGATTTVFAGLNRYFGEIIASATLRHSEFAGRGSDTGVFLTLSRRLGSRNYASISHDTLNQTTRMDIRRSRGSGVPNLQARASAVHRDSQTDLLAAIGVEGSRLGLQLDGSYTPETRATDERATLGLRLQSGLAYTGGDWAWGRDPGRGFVIIDRHATLQMQEVRVSSGAGALPIAQADEWGAALIRTEAPYRPLAIRVDVPEAEAGYDIGPGRYTLLPGRLTGTRITVGTDAFRTAIAVLLVDAEALSLEFGTLTHLDTGTEQAFFTNRTGRAAFNALRPGRYEARLNGRPDLRFTFTIDPGQPAYVDLGPLAGETTP